MSPTDINTRCTTALRALEGVGVIESAWLPGMLVLWSLDEDPAMPLRLTEDASDGHPYTGNPVWSGVRSDREHNDHEIDSEWCRLDLSDPVTAASLIVLVREAWGDPWACAVGRGSDGPRAWEVVYYSGNHRLTHAGATEAESLVAALEAKVREVCGG